MTVTATSQSFRALGTGCLVIAENPKSSAIALQAVRKIVEDIDRACSRFRDDSELQRLNQAEGKRVSISPTFATAIETAMRAAAITEGDLDPTVGNAMCAIGYDRSFDQIDKSRPAARPSFAFTPAWQMIDLDLDALTIRIPKSVRLDLGATAKALATDMAARQAAEAARCGVLVSLGGDIAIAGKAPVDGWHVRIAGSHDPDSQDSGSFKNGNSSETISIESGALATSSVTVRTWGENKSSSHHIVDPKTGRPAEVVWRTVSAAAASCVDANIATTTSIIRGEKAPVWLAGMGLPARLVRHDGQIVRVGDWPKPQTVPREPSEPITH